MDDPNITVDYLARLEEFRQSDKSRDDMILKLLAKYEDLHAKFEQQSDDYNNEDSNPMVFAIMDGDGAVFADKLLTLGEEGGEIAAHQLQSEIKKYIEENHPELNVEHCSIVVQVVLSLEGLAKKIHACGIMPNTNINKELPAFARGFGRAQPLFSFIDVGSGKERADHKIRETLRLWLRIAQCKHIFFGPCHDNGYLTVLEQYRKDPIIAPKMTLIETLPAEPGFTQLGFNILRFPELFRSENLPAKPTISTASLPRTSVITPASHGETTSPLVSKPIAVPPARSQSATPDSWATVGKAGSNSKTYDIAPRTNGKKYYLINSFDQRIDEPLPRPDASSERSYNEKQNAAGRNLCNKFHLGGRCDLGSSCPYYHGKRITQGEQLVLKGKVRSLKCPNGSYCDDVECPLGHHCKFGGVGCTFPNCRFADTHDIDMTPVLKVFEDGSVEVMGRH